MLVKTEIYWPFVRWPFAPWSFVRDSITSSCILLQEVCAAKTQCLMLPRSLQRRTLLEINRA